LIVVAFKNGCYILTPYMTSWVDAHANLPPRARWTAKANVTLRGNQAGGVNPPRTEGFLLAQTEISAETFHWLTC